MLLVVNMLLQWLDDGNIKKLERILWTNNVILYSIDINSNHCPILMMVEDVNNAINKKTVSIADLDDPYIRVISEEDINNKDKLKRDNAWKIIEQIVVKEPEIYESHKRRMLIKSVSSKFGVNEHTVLNYLKRYWRRGKVQNALLPDYYLCGGRGKDKKTGSLKRGRPNKYLDIQGKGINVDDKVRSIFKTAVNRFYYTSAKNTLVLTYELMRKEYFNEDFKFENGIKIPVIKENNIVPTFGQFKYWFEKDRNLKKEIASRKNLSTYEKQNRPILGNSTSETMGPGSIYQIDATVADIYLVSSFNKNWIIGRPVIYAVIDVFSRMVTGIYVGLEGPSWLGAMMALANATSPKVDFCKDYDIEITDEDWPVHYLPESMLADRGEMECKNVENLINGLHIKVQNTPPYRPELKAIVEQYFRTLNLKVKPFLPGVVNPDIRERGEKDYKLDAKLNISQFTKVIIKCILYHNNKQYIKNYNKQEMMIEDGIECIPRNIWNWGIVNCSGKLRAIPEDIVKLNLMPSDKAVVTAKGIRYKGLFYSSKIILREKWFEKARNKGTWKVNICYDPRNMDYIYIKEHDGRNFKKCFLLDYQGCYRGKSLEDIQYLLEEEKIHEKKVEDEELQSKVDLISEIQSIARNAVEISKEEKTNESDTKRKKGIKNNRKIEKMVNRQDESFELEKVKNAKNAEIINLNNGQTEQVDNNNELALLKFKQEEALKKVHE